ncbi:MAG: hypothetical protein ACREFD_15705 [Stellaceae bacterium]
MSKRKQLLLAIRTMLEYSAREAANSGFGLVATLAAAASDAARDEIAALDRSTRPHRGSGQAAKDDLAEETEAFAMVASGIRL